MANQTHSEGDDGPSPSQLRGELKDELGQWIQRQFRLIGVIAVVAGVVGIPAVVSWTVSGLVEKELEHREADWDRLTQRMETSSQSAATAAAEATQVAMQAKSEILRMKKQVDVALESAQAAVDEAVAEAREASNIARLAADEARAAMSTAREVQTQLAIATPAENGLTEKDRAAIQILQTVGRIEPKDSNNRTWRTLAFALDVDSSVAQTPVAELLGRVQRVEYVFDASKFSNPVQSVENRATNFRHSVRVYGATKVTALIYLTNPDAVVERSGMMKLFAKEPQPLK